MGEVADTIRRKLSEALSPERLEIVDDSSKHAGHAGHREGGESHFTVRITSAAFAGQSRVERQRTVNSILADDIRPDRIHALSIHASAPGGGVTVVAFPAVDAEAAALGARLRALREARGLAPETLADRLGVGAEDLIRAERGRLRLTAGQLYAATLALHLPMRLLFEPALDASRLRRL